jgi:hypothetical protein
LANGFFKMLTETNHKPTTLDGGNAEI